MPKLKPLTQEGQVNYNIDKAQREIDHKLRDNRISYTQIARLVGKTPAAISRQFAKGNHITFEVFIACQMLLEEMNEKNI